MYRMTLILPCYNERERLDLAALRRFAVTHPDCRLLAVDDGSDDGTAARLRELIDLGNVEVLELPENRGKAEAVRYGMLHAAGHSELLGFWDADLATPLECADAMSEFFSLRPELEMVTGCRLRRLGADIRRSRLRHLIGRGMATLFSWYLELPVYDTQCGAKLLRAETAQRLFAEPFCSRWLFDVELFHRLEPQRLSETCCCSIYEYPLPIWHDVGGSKLKLRDAFRIGLDFLRIVRHYRTARLQSE